MDTQLYCVQLPQLSEYNHSMKGRCVMSNVSISTSGQIIATNIPLVSTLRFTYWSERCCNCYTKSSCSLLRCSSCKLACYCDTSCQKENWDEHRAECSKLETILKTNNYINKLSDIDDLILLLRVFSKLKKLENSCQINEHGITCGVSHFSKLSECTTASTRNVSTAFLSYASKVCGKPKDIIKSTLIKFDCNNFGILDDLLQCIGAGVYPMAALLNHSCLPNCLLRFKLIPGSKPALQVNC